MFCCENYNDENLRHAHDLTKIIEAKAFCQRRMLQFRNAGSRFWDSIDSLEPNFLPCPLITLFAAFTAFIAISSVGDDFKK